MQKPSLPIHDDISEKIFVKKEVTMEQKVCTISLNGSNYFVLLDAYKLVFLLADLF